MESVYVSKVVNLCYRTYQLVVKQVADADPLPTVQATAQSLTVTETLQDADAEDECAVDDDGPLVLLPWVLCGSCGGPSFTGGVSHSPATRIPKILMHGRWKGGSSGNPGHSNSTDGISGRFHIIIGVQPTQGTISGRIVVE